RTVSRRNRLWIKLIGNAYSDDLKCLIVNKEKHFYICIFCQMSIEPHVRPEIGRIKLVARKFNVEIVFFSKVRIPASIALLTA
ncbi:hypothetical protein, partial [Paenibacillus sp. Marseille-Q7038]